MLYLKLEFSFNSLQISRGANLSVESLSPLRDMFGYIGAIRSLTSGRASFTMQFDRYVEVPSNVQEELVKDKVD